MTETRKTYRAVLSEPKLVIPHETQTSLISACSAPPSGQLADAMPNSPHIVEAQVVEALGAASTVDVRSSPKKRGREEGEPEPEAGSQDAAASQGGDGESRKKKKRKKNKGMNIAT
jgi:ribonuclease P/MRP protein subunit RPP1